MLNSAVPRSTLLIASINIVSTCTYNYDYNFKISALLIANDILKKFQDSRHDNKRHLRLRNGLITRHAYSVTGLARVRGQLGIITHALIN